MRWNLRRQAVVEASWPRTGRSAGQRRCPSPIAQRAHRQLQLTALDPGPDAAATPRSQTPPLRWCSMGTAFGRAPAARRGMDPAAG